LADGDDDTTYTVGLGLSLAGTTFSLNTTYTDGRYWKQNGNTLGAGDFLGAVNNVPLELRAPGGVRIHELTPSLSFGSQTRQMLNLYDSTYGIGVQDYTAYFRTHGGFAWYRDGVHSDTAYDAGNGGTRLVTLESAENRWTLYQANGDPGSVLYGNASGGALSLRRPGGNPGLQAQFEASNTSTLETLDSVYDPQGHSRFRAPRNSSASTWVIGFSQPGWSDTISLAKPNSRARLFSTATKRISGLPALAMITSSPARLRSISLESCVLASWILTVTFPG
jgi:hypothetical protein